MQIAVTSPSFSKNVLLREEVIRIFPDAVFNTAGVKLEGPALADFIKDADGIIVGLEKIDKTIIEGCRKLRIISKYGVGLDNIDCDYCRRNNVHVRWTPGVNRVSVAEMVVAFMISLCRNLFITSVQLKGGLWNKSGGTNLSNRTVGIIGVGNIGKEVVRLLEPFRCKIMVNDIIDQSSYYREHGLIEQSKDEIYRNADIVTVHVPLTDLTRGMIGRRAFTSMKKGSFFINTARAGIVDTKDMTWALKEGVIAGAAVDVYDEEPPGNPDLLLLPNLICTPHIGGNSVESILAMGRSSINHLKEFFKID